MEFFLPFKIPQYPFFISYTDKILFIGSCFSEEIGNRMQELKFKILQNPNGILYDPLSISEAILSYTENKKYTIDDLVEINGLYHSWKHHSKFSGFEKEKILDAINHSQSLTSDFVKEMNILIITLGSAFHYQLKENGLNVSNCHKAPAPLFNKILLTSEQVTDAIDKAIKKLNKFNPQMRVIITVSPVKYLRDGIIENNRSKARLIESAHSLAERNKNVFYFPAYELVTDVLRDYRFYKDDLAHPNETAVNYVFEQFCNSFLDDESKEFITEMKKLLLAVYHRPFVKESEAHQKFIASQLKNIAELEKKYPFVDLSGEKKYFRE